MNSDPPTGHNENSGLRGSQYGVITHMVFAETMTMSELTYSALRVQQMDDRRREAFEAWLIAPDGPVLFPSALSGVDRLVLDIAFTAGWRAKAKSVARK